MPLVLALLAFAASIGGCIFVLVPRPYAFTFSLVGSAVFEELYEDRGDMDEVYRRLAYDLDRFWDANDVATIPQNWDVPAGWKIKGGGGSAVSALKSASLKKGIKDLNAAGYDIYVFPDNENHLHVQQGNG